MSPFRILEVHGFLLLAILIVSLRCGRLSALVPTAVAAPTSLPLPLPSTQLPSPAPAYTVVPGGSLLGLEACGQVRTIRASTHALAGRLTFAADDEPEQLDLSIDLAHLHGAEGDDDADDDLDHLLGMAVNDTLQFHLRPQWSSHLPGVGVRDVHWQGRVSLGVRCDRFATDLWLTPAAHGRCRLQGVGGIDADALRLPCRYLLGLMPERFDIAIAFDLEFCPE